jgi:hypothetical protein
MGIITTLNKLDLNHSEFKTLIIVDLIVALRISSLSGNDTQDNTTWPNETQHSRLSCGTQYLKHSA